MKVTLFTAKPTDPAYPWREVTPQIADERLRMYVGGWYYWATPQHVLVVVPPRAR